MIWADYRKKSQNAEEMEEAVFTDVKQEREANIKAIKERLEEAFAENEDYLATDSIPEDNYGDSDIDPYY